MGYPKEARRIFPSVFGSGLGHQKSRALPRTPAIQFAATDNPT